MAHSDHDSLTEADGNSERDDKGRFAPGNAGGPGNPFAAKTAQLRSALMDAVTDDDIQAVAQTLIQEARSGNVQAGRELLDRTLGKAHQTKTTELTGPGGQPFELHHAPTESLMKQLRGDTGSDGKTKHLPSQSKAVERRDDGPEHESRQ
jgi:hypothetical protein